LWQLNHFKTLFKKPFQMNFYISITTFTKKAGIILSLILLSLFSFSTYAQNDLTADAGADFTACENDVFVSGGATNYETIQWSTSGDGTFESPESLSSAYFPGAVDILAGQVELCLTAYANGNQATDCVVATIGLLPVVEIGLESDAICYDEAYLFQNVTGSNYGAVQWITVNGGGIFSNENSLVTEYYPNPISDYLQGCITIIVYAQGLNPCNVIAEDQMELCFQAPPVVDLGSDTHYVCHGEDYTFADATAQNCSALQWINLNGSGYFENGNSINATYIPNPEFDYPQGCIMVMLYGEPISPCSTAIEEYVNICFQAPPEADAGGDATILSGNTFTPSPYVNNQSSVLWETSGDGTFNDPSLLSPQYFPGIQDQQTGNLTLTLTAFPEPVCSANSSDDLQLTVITEQTVVLNEGLNGLSSYVNIENLNIIDFTAPLTDQLIYAKKGLQVYFPQYEINTFDEATNLNGLIVNLSATGTIDFSGTKTTSTQINLPEGWSLLPVPVSCSLGYQEVIDLLGVNLIIVTEVDGEGVIYPDGNDFSLTELLPGKAYLIKMAAPAQINFQPCN
jgi:hypothetical protein